MKLSKITGSLLLIILSYLPCSFAVDIEVGFSPEKGTAQELVIKVINNAEHDIKMMSYVFTAPDIAKALIKAHRRGVDVKVVLDKNGNTNKANIAAMDLLANAGVELRTNANYPIQHDKVIITDGVNVQTGSFNYTGAAERRNSENVVVMWDAPDVAKSYTQHWESRWLKGETYKPSY